MRRSPACDVRVGANGASALALPFVSGYVFDFGWAFLLFGPFVIVVFGNAVNLTDGLDGLAIVPVMIAAATLGLIAYLAGSAIYSHYLLINHVPLAGDLMVVCGASIGAELGFCGSTLLRPRSSWAIRDRWRLGVCSGPWRWRSNTRLCWL